MNGGKLNYMSAVGFLSKYIKRHKQNFTMFYLGWLFDTLLGIVMPIMFGIMIDEIVYNQNLASFLRISLVFVIMSVFSCILYFLIYAQHQHLMSMYVFDIQRDVFRHLQKCNASYLSDAQTGDIISTIQNYSRECMHFVIRNIIHLANGLIRLTLLTVYIFIINPWIGLFTLAAVPTSVVVNMVFGKKIRKYSNRQREYYGGYISFVYEIFTAIRDIRLLGAVKKVNRDIVKRYRGMFEVNIRSGVSSITARSIIDGMNLVIQLSTFTLAAYLAGKGRMTIGTLTVMTAFFTALTEQVRQTGNSYLDSQNRIGYIQRIYDFMNSPTEGEWPGKNKLDITVGEIRFDNVSFAYEKGGNILQNLTLHIKPGERIAICGKSGCGKTTLGYMLIGFYAAKQGCLSIDGQNLIDCNLKSMRRGIGMVSQDVLLFDGTIRENLLLGKRDATDAEIASALHQAGVGDFTASLPCGVDTYVGAGGTGLSGGQKQRIAIARIYLKNPAIIIFDEATSALDSETEKQIHDAWEAVLAGRTAIVIAHRHNSVMLCDRAAIMDGGRIIEIGIPREMEKSSENFKTLFAIGEE